MTDFKNQTCSMDRRRLLLGGLGAGLALGLTPKSAVAQDDPAASRPKAGDQLVRIDDDTLKPLAPEDIVAGMPQVMAWPMEPAGKIVRRASRLNRVMLLHLDESQFIGETKARSAGGIVAYTPVCTHTGCEVTDWLPDQGFLYCPCHFTKYDPRDGARVVDGPAPRPLPALPLKIEGGQLIVAGPFSARVTFEPA